MRAALFVFCLSRALVLLLLILASHVSVPPPDPDSGLYEPDIVLPNVGRTLAGLRDTVDVGDASWYLVIAIFGYERAPFDATQQHNWAFFPLYPLVVHAAASVTGEFQLTAVAVSNGCFLLALMLLHRYARCRGLDGAAADRAVFYLSLYPTAYFFSLPTTESLFLLVSLGAFLAAQYRRWWLAGVAGALASATRVTGILVLPGLGIAALMWIGQRPRDGRAWLRTAGVLLVPLGVGAFMALLSRDTGNPWAFRDVQSAWGRSPDPGTALLVVLDALGRPNEVSRSWDFRLLNVSVLLLALVAAAVLARRRDWDLAIYTVGGVLLPLTTGSFQALARYVMVLFPVFLVLGLAGRRPMVDALIRTVFAVLLGLLTALFGARFTIAMA